MEELKNRSAAEQGALMLMTERLTDAPDWVKELRARSAEIFWNGGLPHRRIEDWKYTDLRNELSAELRIAEPLDQVEPEHWENPFAKLNPIRIWICNGYLFSFDPLPQEIQIASLADLLTSSNPVTFDNTDLAGDSEPMLALNAGLMNDGAIITVSDNAVVERPVQVIYHANSSKPVQFHTRNIIRVGKNAQVTLIESFAGSGKCELASTHVAHLDVADNAGLSHICLGHEYSSASQVRINLGELGQNAEYRAFTGQIGGGLTRHETRLALTGENAKVSLASVARLTDNEHSDFFTLVDHRAPNCTVEQTNRMVLDGASKGVFQGKFLVGKPAQKTDAQMISRAILLSDKAEMDAKPELEIYADDVKCAHGATIGTLDEDAMFFLRSRGIPEDEARQLLIAAFLEGAVENIVNEQLCEILKSQVGK